MTYQGDSGPLHNLYDFLVGKNRKTGQIQNTHLAESWEVDSTATVWTFHLKEDVPFYMNGKASDVMLAPIDIRWTWLLQAAIASDRSSNSGTWRPWLASGDGSDIVIDGNTVTFNLDIVQPDANVYLSEDWTFGIISKEYWDSVGGEDGYIEHPIGTGAFSFVEYVNNVHFLLEKNVDHYRYEPWFDELQFLWTTEPATMWAQMVTGEAHIGDLPSHLHDEMKSNGMSIARSTIPGDFLWGAIPWYLPEDINGMPTPYYDGPVPTRNVKVREALNIAIDREEINDRFFDGDAIPGAVPHMAEWWGFFQDRWAPVPGPDGNTGAAGGWPYPYDPARAKELLAEAGYPDGFELNFFVSTTFGGLPQVSFAAVAITSMWEEIGIEVNLEITEDSPVPGLLADRVMSGAIFLASSPPQSPSVAMGRAVAICRQSLL